MTEMPAGRGRGRPVEVDRNAVAMVALRLFDERGFEVVTMDEIADAARVGRSTLFRYFPSKTSLAWDGLDGSAVRLEQALQQAGSEDAVEALVQAHISSLAMSADEVELSRQRLRLIESEPALMAAAAPVLRRGEESAIKFLIARGWPDDVGTRALSAALSAATMRAAMYWATHGDGRPADLVAEALHAVAAVFHRPGRASSKQVDTNATP